MALRHKECTADEFESGMILKAPDIFIYNIYSIYLNFELRSVMHEQ